jgi:hypothetical protein
MRKLVIVSTASCLSLISTAAWADFQYNGPGWYAFTTRTDNGDMPMVGGPFADKDTCLRFLRDHYGAKLRMPSDPDAIPELEGHCGHYTQANSIPDATADYDPPSAN